MQRIRRTDKIPIDFAPKPWTKMKHRLDLPEVTVSYSRSSSWVGYIPQGIRVKEVDAWVSCGAALELKEYSVPFLIDDEDFLDIMDEESMTVSDLACVLCESWHDIAGHFGKVLHFHTAWSSPHAPAGLWAKAANALIAKEFPKHKLLTMKAFPLEYTGEAPEGSELHPALIRRIRAMERYYAKLFSVKPLPYGDGWLYRINKGPASCTPLPRNKLKSSAKQRLLQTPSLLMPSPALPRPPRLK